ncbi:Nuclear speckle splicing regulatory protein 1 [Phytophthora nicotianae]|uniref:Nuclear speckle splicing regulatory protein 1 n=1 Tax=Phytophthora nicotianae TaxID=4792 RepID=A0A0W8BPA7_PHYNI|nr:Nuclear speckle splicing regulatory protein 1 [Phytophthora nicotianae]
MAFSMKISTGKNKKKPLAAPFASGTKQYGLVLPKKDAKKKSQVDKVRAQALAEDASVFDYDAVYDDMKSARETEAEKRAVKREEEKKKPKYISTLLQQAKIREVENERIRERRLLNERKADDALYGDKEKLVSASYKRKLQEMQRWDAEDARLAAVEEQEDVTKQGEHAMAGFYANLNKNIAMGGSTDNARKRKEVSTKAEPPKDQCEEAKPSKEDAIAAARARFLARKAQRKT